MLPRIRIVQIGDVHLPSAAKVARPLDLKDELFPVSLSHVISRPPLKTVFRRIHDLLEKQQVDGVVFMGDLTDYGKLQGYEACAAYIAESLQLGNARNHAHIPVGIVPGNHDVDRSLARQPGLAKKFAPLNVALGKHGLPKLPAATNVVLPVSNGAVGVDIHLLNSCWGCGEEQYIPDVFRAKILTAIDDTFSGADHEAAKKLYYDRQLDTPAFSEETLEAVVNELAKASSKAMILVAHHNLLPQRMTRLAPYTELVNSGALRSSLLDSPRTSIYLHGHIHDEPIEVISQPSAGCVVSISAPEAVRGFNYLELIHTKTGTPLSVRVTPYRFDKSGVLRPDQPVSSDLLGRRRRSSNEKLASLYGQLMQKRECYWSTVRDVARTIDPGIDEAELTEMLELLSCDDSVSIENYDLPTTSWIVRATI